MAGFSRAGSSAPGTRPPAALKSCPTIAKMSCGGFARGGALLGLLAGVGLRRRVWRQQHAAQRAAGHARHAARGPRRQLRLQERADAGARRPGRAGRTIRVGDHDDSPDAVGAHQPLHRRLADVARGARQHRVLRRRPGGAAGRDLEGPWLSHRRLRRRVRARRPLGHRAGLRHLLRRVRPVRGRRTWPRCHPAPRRRGGRRGARVARPAGGAAVLRLGPPLRSAHAV